MKEQSPFIKDLESQVKKGSHKLYEPEILGRKDEEFFINLPHSDLQEWIYESDDIYQADLKLGTWRLSRIRSLSFLVNLGNLDVQYFDVFNHDRHEHTLFVAKVSEKIMRSNEMPENEVKKSIFAAVAHDRATPALGDAVKPVDIKNLHEEDFWWEGVGREAWSYLEEIGGTKEEIDDIIHNRGLLGEVLDIADRISYVMRDMGAIALIPNFKEETVPYWADFENVLMQDTRVGNIYNDLRINRERKEIYFSDAERLRRFLEIRALLHRDLYLNKVSQARDLFIGNLVKPIYSTNEEEEDKLTPQKLRIMGDFQAERFISSKYEGFGEYGELLFSRYLVGWRPEFIETFDSLKQAEKRKKQVEKEFNIIGIKECMGFNTGVDYKVADGKGNVVKFRDADPYCTKRLEEIAESTKKVYLYYTSEELPRLKKDR